MKVIKSIELFFQEGASDKLYHASIVEDGGGTYSVHVEWGRRGGNLNKGTKAIKVALAKAEKEFDKVVREKTKKGYEAITAELTPAAVAPPEGKGSGSKTGKGGRKKLSQKAQLLSAIDEERAESLISDPDYVAQQKIDGMRVLLHTGEEVAVTNRNGELIDRMPELEKASEKLPQETIVDGELVSGAEGTVYWLFDLLQVEGESLRASGYLDRYQRLVELCPKRAMLKVLPTAETKKQKRSLFDRLARQQAEGIVFKNGSAPYAAGRSSSGGAQLKYKFIKSADVFLIANAGNAYQMAVYDGGKMREVGKIFAGTTNESRKRIDELLASGEKPVAEVRYLYATDTYTLFQPVFRALRDDKTPEECGLDQLVQTDRSIIAIE